MSIKISEIKSRL